MDIIYVMMKTMIDRCLKQKMFNMETISKKIFKMNIIMVLIYVMMKTVILDECYDGRYVPQSDHDFAVAEDYRCEWNHKPDAIR